VRVNARPGYPNGTSTGAADRQTPPKRRPTTIDSARERHEETIRLNPQTCVRWPTWTKSLSGLPNEWVNPRTPYAPSAFMPF
jgi:hypothetical protein